jgi:hypothetical protein
MDYEKIYRGMGMNKIKLILGASLDSNINSITQMKLHMS